MTKEEFHTIILNDLVGGSSAYYELTNWAKGALRSSEINTFNESVSSGNLEKSKLAVARLLARYVVANGRPPYTLIGN